MPICPQTHESFTIAPEDLAFYDKLSPVINGKKFLIPPPTLSPNARLRRRLTYRNQIHVFRRLSSTTGKEIFSMYPEGTPFPVIAKDEWWSDSWDACTYGRDFDFSRPFFEQFFELRNVVPHYSLSSVEVSDNCEFVNNAGWSKNCYFIFNTCYNDGCMYLETCDRSTDCLDCSRSPHCELCHDCVACTRCYELQSSTACTDCRESYFLLQCYGCDHCFGCCNLHRQSYCIFNRKVSRAEYEAFIESIDLSRYSQREEFRLKAAQFFSTQPRPHIISERAENVTGNYIYNSRSIVNGYSIDKGEDLKNCFNIDGPAKDAQDVSIWGHEFELAYECCAFGQGFGYRWCYECWNGSSECSYCLFCLKASNCFGCVGIQNKSYCVFNRQYSPPDYFNLVERIITHMQRTGEWGEYFPAKYSHTYYNLSLAQRYFPRTRAQALEEGLNWYDRPELVRPHAIAAESLPDGLPESDRPIEVIGLGASRPFLITTREIQMLRRFNAPLARVSYDARMEERQRRVAGIFLYSRQCAKSGSELITSYPPSDPAIVWDREVYEREFN